MKGIKLFQHAVSNSIALFTTALILASSVAPAFSFFSQSSAALPGTGEVLGAQSPIRGNNVLADYETTLALPAEPIDVSAKSYLVYDQETGQVVAEKDSADKLSIASLTKLMTALVVYRYGDFNDTVTIDQNDLLPVAPDLNLRLGDEIKVGDLFNAMLVGSENDAAKTLGNYISEKTGTSVIDLMNKEAAALGMSNTHFSNPMGFDSSWNYSTARDLKNLVQETRQLGAFVSLGRKESYSFVSESGIKYACVSTNKLLADHPEIEAIKTGYTASAQGAMVTQVSVHDKNFVLIILDSQDREQDTLNLEKDLSKNT